MNQELRKQAIEDWARADGWPVSRLRKRIIDRPDSPEAYAVEQRTLVLELMQSMKLIEHKADQALQGQYTKEQLLGVILHEARKLLATIDQEKEES